MKKLTAGIFATILGLTAVDAFAAVPTGRYNVASVKYVNEAMNAVSGDVSGLETRVSANETAIGTLNSEQDTQDLAIKAAADAAAVADAKAVANTALIGDVEEGKTVVQMIGEAKTAATYNDTEVRGLIATAQGQADKGVADAATAQAAAEAAQAAAEAADGKAQTAQNEVDALETNVATNYVAWTDVDDSYVASEYTF